VRPHHPAGQTNRAPYGAKESADLQLAIRQACGGKVERVASYHLSVHPNVSRGKGQSLVRTAAYNDRAKLIDERTGEVWDYRHLGAALASGMYPPKGAPEWAHDLGQLVNEVERFEKRSDAQLAMNLDIALPHEQTLEQNRRLMQDFVREQFQRKGYAAHFAIHPPDRDGDQRNIHAHMLVTLRKIDEHGFARTKAEQQERYRNRGEYVEGLRDAWEKLANRHLERNGYDARIDRRSLEDQGIEREPQQHRGPAVTAMEREGNVTRIGDEIRRRQHHYAELKALGAEERQIDAEIIDLEARRAERQAREAAKGQVDDIRPDTASRDFSGAASSAAEPAQKATEAREAPAAPSAPERENTRATEPEREPAPARDAPRVIYLGAPADERVAERAASIIGGLADSAEKALGAALDYAADFIAPPPPPTKEQAEQMRRAAEEQRERDAAAAPEREKDARLQELLDQIRRSDQQARYDRWTGRRLDGDHDHDRDNDYSRGRERER
jgi:MobA/MobL family